MDHEREGRPLIVIDVVLKLIFFIAVYCVWGDILDWITGKAGNAYRIK